MNMIRPALFIHCNCSHQVEPEKCQIHEVVLGEVFVL